MLQIEKTIVSEDIIEKEFVCNLSACKGACCIEGEAGAPLNKEEGQTLEEIYPIVKPYLREEGIKAIKEQGVYTTNSFGELETTLVNGAECAYLIYDKNQMALCGIEQAFIDKKIEWKKPLSCHLYPIRITEYSSFSAVNYHKWQICDDACSLGKELQVPVFKFVKEALIRKFGESWYQKLEEEANNHK